MRLGGIHHLTAVSADIRRNHAFYTRDLGLRLVKKSVNQDDVSAYHLFYADGIASPGSDLTFFDFPVGRELRGGRSIVRTALRVAGEGTLVWWRERLAALGAPLGEIGERAGRLTLDFEDFEGQRLSLVDDGGEGAAHPWARSSVPAERQIRGLGPVTIAVPDLGPTEDLLTDVLGMERIGDYRTPGAASGSTHVFQMGSGGAGAELHVAVEPSLPVVRPGAGGAHHVAFRIDDADYDAWTERLRAVRMPFSGPVDRFYFRSLYFREPGGVLFEIATDGPGFATDEPLETLGERLALPPSFEPRRAQIEAGLKSL